MTIGPDRARTLRRAATSLIAAAGLYQGVAWSGLFPAVLFPDIPVIVHTMWTMTADGTLPMHVAFTLYRVLTGFVLAVALGLSLGTLMARVRPVERFFMPLIGALMPIPSFALVPLFMLWFGIGNLTTILIVFYAATFPILFNTWSGVRAVNPLWLRAAGVMGAGESALFWKVIIPGAFPMIVTGLRQAFLRSWVAVIGAEMLASSDWGLGWVIFDAQQFLQTDVMMASVATIGVIGFLFERLVFGTLEQATVTRWGMVRQARQ